MNSEKPTHLSTVLKAAKAVSSSKKANTVVKAATVLAMSLSIVALTSEYSQISYTVPDVKVDAKEGIVTHEVADNLARNIVFGNTEVIVKEKSAKDASMNFSNKEELKYAKEATVLLNSPSPEADVETTVKKGTELKVLGYNKEGYARIMYNNETMYIKAEKLINKEYIFTEADKTAITTTVTTVYKDVDDAKVDKNAIDFINNGTEVQIVLENEDFLKVTSPAEGYICSTSVSEDVKYEFETTSQAMYSKGENNVYENLEEESEVLTTTVANAYVEVIGTSEESEYSKVNVNGQIGYMETTSLSPEQYDLYPFLTLSAKSNVTYNVGNMPDGAVSVLPDSEKTESNVYLLAQLIECEAGGCGFEGTRAVGTVVANRVYANGWGGSTIKDVIEYPNQFSPVTSGKVYRTVPSQASYEAAVDIVYNGYRSFPAYVLSFQSIRDGYWPEQITYLTTYTENGTYPQYFSYRPCDVSLYQ